MCDEEANDIGDLVPNDRVIYRACTRSSFLSSNKDAVEGIAFQKDGKNRKDGLSLALSVADSVKKFPKNHGAIRIAVAAIHGLNRGLEVRFDTTDPTHVRIRNLPCMDRSIEEKELALAVSAELAAIAVVEANKRVPVPPAVQPADPNPENH